MIVFCVRKFSVAHRFANIVTSFRSLSIQIRAAHVVRDYDVEFFSRSFCSAFSSTSLVPRRNPHKELTILPMA